VAAVEEGMACSGKSRGPAAMKKAARGTPGGW
jgi:hypothetical protein